MWVLDQESGVMEQRELSFVPGLYKIFDEILVNAADNKQRDSAMNCIKIDIDPWVIDIPLCMSMYIVFHYVRVRSIPVRPKILQILSERREVVAQWLLQLRLLVPYIWAQLS